MSHLQETFGRQFQGVKVLVTGGAGFIGSHLADALLTLDADVTVLDDMSGGFASNIDYLKAKHPAASFTFVQGSILDDKAVAKATQGAQFIFHQAALGSVPRSIEQPELYMNVNVMGTLKVIQAGIAQKTRRVMLAASSSAYGDAPTLPKHENMPVLPRSPYAVSKVACEGLMLSAAVSYGIDTVSLRYFNIFGPRQNANSAYAAVIAAFAKALGAGQAPTIYGDGSQSRDFTHVDNAVLANLLAAASPRPLVGQVINVATGRTVSVNELAMSMARVYGLSCKPTHLPERAGDVKHSSAELSKARELLGYKPVTSFELGLERTIAWYRNPTAS